jgi:hypothetical protein
MLSIMPCCSRQAKKVSRAAQQWARDWRFGAETAVGGEGVALGVVGVVVRRVIFVVVRWMDG